VRIAETICYDHALAEVLGEIMDIVGPYGQVDIRVGYGWTLKREYVEGAYWDGGLYSPDLFINPGTQKAELVEPWILISDLVIEEARQLVPALDCAMGANARTLVVMANQLSEQAIGLLQAVNKDSDKMRVIGVKTPEASTHQRAEILPDMAILLGGRPFFQAAGETLERIKPEDFGQARKAWANRVHFGVVGGKGDPRRLRRHIAKLRAAYGSAEKVEDREHILQRMGKLLGGSATCWIGGMTETETEMRKEAAERMVRALRGAITEGVVPGGGAALLACQPALKRKLEETENADARAAYQILFQSLEAPTRVLVANAGYDASPILGEIRRAGPGCTFDVLQNRIVNAACAGLYDAASVVREAVFSAVSSAALALTIDILVHPRKLKLSMEP
jgi:chaperonin GroEL